MKDKSFAEKNNNQEVKRTRVVVGLDSGDTAFDTAGETGGSKDAVVVSHTHTATQVAHSHTLGTSSGNNDASGTGPTPQTGTSYSTSTAQPAITVDSTGSSGTNANLQPYVVAYVWKRTA